VEPRARAIAWRVAAQDAVCDRVEAVGSGTLISASDLPTYWDYNALRVEEPSDASAAELAEHAEALQGDLGLAHRKVEIHDEATGARLIDPFLALGWTAARHEWMLHEGATPERPAAVEQVHPRVVLDLRREWAGEFPGGGGADFVAIEDRAEARLPGGLVSFAAFDPWPVAFLRHRVDGVSAEITDVYCTPSHRGRGLGGALVDGAIAGARAEGVQDLWIVADADDRARALYARHGFTGVWTAHHFTRSPAQGAPAGPD
jgi:ribosomal protein S18 acetylase RimI-like enzyme